MSRYSKNLEYDMREEATPWPSSALAAPTLPKAGSAATLAARALQNKKDVQTQHAHASILMPIVISCRNLQQ